MWGDVVLRVRGTREVVPIHRHGVELDGFFVSAKCHSGADDGRPGKFAIGGTSGAATHPIPAAGSQAALTAVLGRSYSNHHRQQSGQQRPRQGQPVALGPADRRALSADACTVRRKRRDPPARSPNGSAFTASGTSRSAAPLAREGLRVSLGGLTWLIGMRLIRRRLNPVPDGLTGSAFR